MMVMVIIDCKRPSHCGDQDIGHSVKNCHKEQFNELSVCQLYFRQPKMYQILNNS